MARSCTPLPPALAVGMPCRVLRHFSFTARTSYDAAAQPIWPIRVLVSFFAKKEIDFRFVLHGKHVSDQGQTLIRQPLAASRRCFGHLCAMTMLRWKDTVWSKISVKA